MWARRPLPGPPQGALDYHEAQTDNWLRSTGRQAGPFLRVTAELGGPNVPFYSSHTTQCVRLPQAPEPLRLRPFPGKPDLTQRVE